MPYIQNTPRDVETMLRCLGVDSLERLFDSIPQHLRLRKPLPLPPASCEPELVQQLSELASRNLTLEDLACFLGAGSYNHYVPTLVDSLANRSEFVTAYTPYQAEASQGVLQLFFEYQTMICRLTGMDVSNASHYDGATALAEAVLMSTLITRRKHALVARTLHPELRRVLRTYLTFYDADSIEVEPREGVLAPDQLARTLDQNVACVVVQQPNFLGCLEELEPLAEKTHECGALLVVSADPSSLGLLRAPGRCGADLVAGDGQTLGTPPLFGGPSFGFLAARGEYVRRLPGRVVGQTTEARGGTAYVLTLQTREQHIRREKATSNICTNQALMALRAAVYLLALGKQGLRDVAELSCRKAHYLAERIARLPGYELAFRAPFLREFVVRCPRPPAELNRLLLREKILGGLPLQEAYPEMPDHWLLCTTEKTSREQLDALIEALQRRPGE